MLFTENDKKLYLDVIGYQFPDIKLTDGEYNHDAQWLNCQIKYFDGSCEYSKIDPCIEACEIELIVEELSNVLSGAKEEFVSDFVEPYLEVSILKEGDKIRFIISFEYEYSDEEEKVWKINCLANEDYAYEILSEFKKLASKYPSRI